MARLGEDPLGLLDFEPPADQVEVGINEIIRAVLEATPSGNEVLWAELVACETRFDVPHEIWDVSDDFGEWWVIAPKIELYAQELFPDYNEALRYHLNRAAGPGPAWRAEHFWA